MTNVVKIPDYEKIDVEAGEWISRINRGLSSSEKVEYQKWVSKDQRHYYVMMSLAHLWDDMEDLSRLAELFPEEGLAEHSGFTFSYAMSAALAAVMIAVIGLVSVNLFFSFDPENIYETSIGEQSLVSLQDGSQLTLNTNSLVTVIYDNNHRIINLERGEIHIDVAHDKSRPLSVKAGDRVIQAVGTAFNVELLDGKRLELVVTDGEVRVAGRDYFEQILSSKLPRATIGSGDQESAQSVRLPSESLSVLQGERVVLGVENEQLVKVSDKEIEMMLSWQAGSLEFNGEPLENAISEISRYTSVEFEFDDDEIRHVRIAGVFKVGDVNGLLLALDDTFNISSRKIDKGKYSLYRDF